MKKTMVLLFVALSTCLCASTEKNHPDQVRIAAVQFPGLSHQSEQEFLATMGRYINEAEKKHVKILLFPELLTLNLLKDPNHVTVPQYNKIVHFLGKYKQYLQSMAKSKEMIIIGGTTLTKKDNTFYNTAIIAFPNGDIKTVDKSLLTPWELSHLITGIGQSEPLSFETPWGRVVVLICYEAESPEIISKVSKINPNMIFIPSNTGGLFGLERVSIAARFIALSEVTYTLLTGVTTNIAREKITDQGVGQAIFALPKERGYPLKASLGTFNQPDMLVVDADIKKIEQDKRSSQVTNAARDYLRQHH